MLSSTSTDALDDLLDVVLVVDPGCGGEGAAEVAAAPFVAVETA